jgi:hypothetical protein
MRTLLQVAQELGERLTRIFLHDAAGKRPVDGKEQKFANDPHWRDLVQFHEYFHGDTGAGIGATHQTGWTGCVAAIMKTSAVFTADVLLKPGAEAAIYQPIPPKRVSKEKRA